MDYIRKRKKTPSFGSQGLVFWLLLAVLAVSIVFVPTVIVMASNITDAIYSGTVRISNNNTAATNVFTTCNISTQQLIDGDYINQSCNNTAIRTNAGADTAYMPAAGNNTDWCIYVSSINENDSLDYKLYTGGQAMDGKIRYFPSSGGMTTVDSASLELGDNFTIEQKGWWDTSAGSNKYAVVKPANSDNYSYNVFEVSVSDTEEITATIADYASSFNATASSGYIRRYSQPTWTDAHDSANGSQVHVPSEIKARASKYAVDNWAIDRGYLYFDTSALDDNETITRAILLLNFSGKAKADAGDYADFHIVEGIQQDPLVKADFGAQLPYIISGGSLAYDDIASGYNAMVLNATGIGWINKTGTTKFCTRLKGDSDNITPTGDNHVYFYGQNLTGKEPKLLISTNYATVTATGVSSGEHTLKTLTDNTSLFVGIGADIEDADFPITSNLTFNAPLWHTESYAAPSSNFTTKDATEHSCNVTGANWTSDGYYFDGTNDLISLGATKFDTLTECTIGLWYKPNIDLDGQATHRYLFVFYKDDNNRCFGYYSHTANKFKFLNHVGGVSKVDISASGGEGESQEWHHWACVFGTGGAELWIDGASIGTDNSTECIADIAATTANYIGTFKASNSPWSGDIGEFRVYNRALTPTEIQANYNATKWKYENSDEFFHYNLLGANVTDNSENWTFISNYSMPYMEFHKISINGTLQQHIEWENDSNTFSDLSGNNHDVTPTFRTSSSDADVTAELITFEPISTAEADDWTLTQAGTMVGNATAPPGMYDELSFGNIPGTPVVNAVVDNAGMPRAMFWFPISFLVIVVVGLAVGRFSLLAQAITMSVLIFLAAGAILAPWLGILFLIDSLAVVVAANQFGW